MKPASAPSTPSAFLLTSLLITVWTAPANRQKSSPKSSASALLLLRETRRISSLRNLSPERQYPRGTTRREFQNRLYWIDLGNGGLRRAFSRLSEKGKSCAGPYRPRQREVHH